MRNSASGLFLQVLLENKLLPPKLEEEIAALKLEYEIEVHEAPNVVYLVIHSFETSSLYSRLTTTLLLQIPRSYPDAGLDMFWTEEGLLLTNGAVPQAGDVIEDHIGKRWRRFSWHPQFGGSGKWDPNIHDVRTYLVFIRLRFQQP